MRVDKPRIAPLEPDEWSEDAASLLQPIADRGRVINIYKTMANHPDLARRWMVFGGHILGNSSLAPRERELAILRIGYLCEAGYEWGQHVVIARQVGLSDQEIRSCKTGAETPDIPELHRLIFQATDELHTNAHVSDNTWNALAKHYSTQQMMDLVFTVGQYNLVSMALNSFGVQLDEGVPGWEV